MVGWHHTWITSCRPMVKPSHEFLELPRGSLQWTNERPSQLKRALMEAPFLGLSSLEKTFELFTYERKSVALSVLPQHMGEHKWAAAYVSKKMDPVAKQWPGCSKFFKKYYTGLPAPSGLGLMLLLTTVCKKYRLVPQSEGKRTRAWRTCQNVIWGTCAVHKALDA